MWAGSPSSVDTFWKIYFEHLPTVRTVTPDGSVVYFELIRLDFWLDYLENLRWIDFVFILIRFWLVFGEGVLDDTFLRIYLFFVVLEGAQ